MADLKIPGNLKALDEVLTDADGGGTTAAEATERLLTAQIHAFNTLPHPALVVDDEIHFLRVSRNGAILFFQLGNRRYEDASTVLTWNQGFERWDEILHDEVIAAALLDRLLHRCHIVNIDSVWPTGRPTSAHRRARQVLRAISGWSLRAGQAG